MRRAFFAILGLLAVALLAHTPSGPAQAQGRQDFTLVNRTGYQIDEIYIGPSSSNSWGRDILGDNVLADRQTFDVRFGTKTSACQWDIKVVYNDGDTSEFRRLDLCSVSRVTLYWNRQAGTTRFVIE